MHRHCGITHHDMRLALLRDLRVLAFRLNRHAISRTSKTRQRGLFARTRAKGRAHPLRSADQMSAKTNQEFQWLARHRNCRPLSDERPTSSFPDRPRIIWHEESLRAGSQRLPSANHFPDEPSTQHTKANRQAFTSRVARPGHTAACQASGM
jgi:hypothetical protein